MATAHDLGMHVILDWVANHTAWDNQLVTEHPERIPAFVEEALRVYSIVTTNRIVTRDVEFAVQEP